MAKYKAINGYTPELGRKVCDCISSGMTLKEAANECGLVNQSCIPSWRVFPEFDRLYRAATEARMELDMEGLREMVDTGLADVKSTGAEEPKMAMAIANMWKLKVETRKWEIAKRAPRVYGEKISAELSGAKGEPVGLQVVLKGAEKNINV